MLDYDSEKFIELPVSLFTYFDDAKEITIFGNSPFEDVRKHMSDATNPMHI